MEQINGNQENSIQLSSNTNVGITSNEEENNSNIKKIEDVLINGDLRNLSPIERVSYYKKLCEVLNLNPWTKPFDYIQFQGKLTLYANAKCTSQLSEMRKISIKIVSTQESGDLIKVHVQASDNTGRSVDNIGVVSKGNVKGGDALGNLIMKAYTKAARRAVLLFCGLGILDKTEVDSFVPNFKEGILERKEIIEDPAKLLKREYTKMIKRFDELGIPEELIIRKLHVNPNELTNEKIKEILSLGKSIASGEINKEDLLDDFLSDDSKIN